MPRLTPDDTARIDKMLADQRAAAEIIFGADDFRAIIVGQTYIETVIERLWKRQLFVPEAFNQSGFERHVQLGVALGEVPPHLAECLQKASAIRNILAHHLGGHVKEEAVRELRAAADRVPHKVMRDEQHPNKPLYTFRESIDMICEHARRQNSYGAAALSQDALFVRAVLLMIYVVLIAAYNAPPQIHPRARQQLADEVLRIIDGTTEDGKQPSPYTPQPHP